MDPSGSRLLEGRSGRPGHRRTWAVPERSRVIQAAAQILEVDRGRGGLSGRPSAALAVFVRLHEDELRRSFISLITHEFRTPLASLKTSFDLIQEAEEIQGLDQPYQRLLTNVSRSVWLMNQLTNDPREVRHSRLIAHPKIFYRWKKL